MSSSTDKPFPKISDEMMRVLIFTALQKEMLSFSELSLRAVHFFSGYVIPTEWDNTGDFVLKKEARYPSIVHDIEKTLFENLYELTKEGIVLKTDENAIYRSGGETKIELFSLLHGGLEK